MQGILTLMPFHRVHDFLSIKPKWQSIAIIWNLCILYNSKAHSRQRAHTQTYMRHKLIQLVFNATVKLVFFFASRQFLASAYSNAPSQLVYTSLSHTHICKHLSRVVSSTLAISLNHFKVLNWFCIRNWMRLLLNLPTRFTFTACSMQIHPIFSILHEFMHIRVIWQFS